MYLNLFCNVLSAAASAGDFSVQLTSLNASANVVVTLTATGNTAGMPADDMAANSITQFQTQLIQYGCAYDGAPVLSTEVPVASWRVMWTDHVVTFFSECQFRLKISSNTTGATIVASHEPLLITLDDFDTYSNLIKTGATLTEAEKILLITSASDQVTSYLNNLLVVAGYVRTEVGFYQRSFFLNQGFPVQSFDPPKIAPPGLFTWYAYFILLPWIRWSLNPDTGELFYQPNQNLLNWPEPSSLNYQFKCSYTAGNLNLPAHIIIAMAMLIKAILTDPGAAKSLKTGSFQIQYRDRSAILSALQMLDDLKL